MQDLIKLLPDAIANQIAAGEVVQRPASVVKELIENSIDAGADHIQLIIKEAGKALVQVVDNGIGMSETDARLCFERHATSKIQGVDDLFYIKTMGFRGEALPSIAAIAQVELKTKLKQNSLGIRIKIEGSKILKQEPVSTGNGTSISVKNLFYNVPARRKFLKGDPVEMKHILDEFQRLALANPSIRMSLHHNDKEVYILPSSNLRQRIVNLFGPKINEKLVPLGEETDLVKISGFIGKPEAAKKRRGDQYLFVNNRFIKSHYLNHAVKSAFQGIIEEGSNPFYVIFLEIDPARIDINVHPTKQEIKFQDERVLYNYLKVACKHALGAYSITPSIDFENAGSMATMLSSMPGKRKELESGQDWGNQKEAWGNFYKETLTQTSSSPDQEPERIFSSVDSSPHQEVSDSQSLQINNQFIIAPVKSGILLIDQQAAHERILFEEFINILKNQKVVATQKELFPITKEFSPADAEIFTSIRESVNQLGFEVEDFGKNTFIIHGIPAHFGGPEPGAMLDYLLDLYKSNLSLSLGWEEKIAKSMAECGAIKKGKKLEKAELQSLIDRLFACELPYKSPSGRNCFIQLDQDELEMRFNK